MEQCARSVLSRKNLEGGLVRPGVVQSVSSVLVC